MEDRNREQQQHMEELSDIEIVKLVKGGFTKAYSQLVKRHQKTLMRLILRFLKDKDASEDVVQEAFIKAYEKLHMFEERASFKSWLFQIGVNTARNKLREARDGMTDIDEVPLAVAAVAETQMVHQSVAQTLQLHIEQLPVRQKTALVLRVYEDLSFKEIAEIMECPYDTAKANYRHALLKLREDLSAQKDLREWTEEVGGFFQELQTRTMEVEL